MIRVAPRVLAGALLLSTTTAFAAQAPIAPGERPVDGSTEAQLWYAMDRAEKELKDSPSRVRDPALEGYVHDVACRVVGDYCGDLRVYIIDSPVFNASMAPNGTMIVYTGALLRLQDEAELSVLLGHEFAHYRNRHTLQAWNSAKGTSAFTASFTVLTGFNPLSLAVQLAGAVGMAGFSRDKEREADRVGYARATELQYDPQAGVRVWSRMLREEQANTRNRPVPVFASHPKTSERLEDVTATARTLPASGTTERERYRAAVRPFLARWLDEELSRRTYDTSIQVITDLRTEAEEDLQGTYTFYLAEAYRRRRHDGDDATASRYYAEAVSHADAPAIAWREQGYAFSRAGDRAAAATALRTYLDKAPQADDRAFVAKDIDLLETSR